MGSGKKILIILLWWTGRFFCRLALWNARRATDCELLLCHYCNVRWSPQDEIDRANEELRKLRERRKRHG